MFDHLKKVKRTKSVTIYFSEDELNDIEKAMKKEKITNRSAFIGHACIATVNIILNKDKK